MPLNIAQHTTFVVGEFKQRSNQEVTSCRVYGQDKQDGMYMDITETLLPRTGHILVALGVNYGLYAYQSAGRSNHPFEYIFFGEEVDTHSDFWTNYLLIKNTSTARQLMDQIKRQDYPELVNAEFTDEYRAKYVAALNQIAVQVTFNGH